MRTLLFILLSLFITSYALSATFEVDEECNDGLFVRGDANGDGEIDQTDAIVLLSFAFLGELLNACEIDAMDFNDDGLIDNTDGILALEYANYGEPNPAAPFPQMGVDNTPDELGNGTSPSQPNISHYISQGGPNFPEEIIKEDIGGPGAWNWNSRGSNEISRPEWQSMFKRHVEI